MTIRIMAGLLGAVLLLLQYRIWASPDGMREVWRLEQAIEVQSDENTRLGTRNRTLAAEVRDLKEGRKAIEERARTDLGMVKSNETFFQVVPPAQAGSSTLPASAAPATGPRTAQAAVP
jgi:cell division protein FtsB